MTALRADLNDLLLEALKLRGRLAIRGQELDVRWVQSASPFEPRTLKREGSHAEGFVATVQACLMPVIVALAEATGTMPSKEATIFRAMVVLQ